jgi:hypothetical protein
MAPPWIAPAEGGLVQQRPADSSGDYEYDLVHEAAAGGASVHRADERAAPAPVRRPVELDQDMSYDEAHDF